MQWWTRGNKWECDLHKSIALSAIHMAHHDVTRMAHHDVTRMAHHDVTHMAHHDVTRMAHWSILCAGGPMHKSIAPSAL